MKKLIAPALLLLTVFASCSKDETKPITKADILTTNVGTSIKSTSKLTTFTVGGQDITANLQDLKFEFTSNVYAGYSTSQLFTDPAGNSFTVPDVALGLNTLKTTARSKTTDDINHVPTNKFIIAPPAFSINSITDFKDYLANDPKPYLEYETYQQETIKANGNSIAVALQPITGKIATAFRLSDNDIQNGVYYEVTAHNNVMNVDEFKSFQATDLGVFESYNKDAKTGNVVSYKIDIFDMQGTLLKTYNVDESFIDGKSVNTIYFINKNSIYKDTATISLTLVDLADEDADKPLD